MTRYSEVRFTISMKQKSMGVSSSAADKELPDSLIRMQIERDVYKELYMNLLKESMTLGKQVN